MTTPPSVPGDSPDAAAPPASAPDRPARLRFPRAARLTRAGEFRRVKDRGRSWPGRLLVLGVLRDAAPDGVTRVGLITSRRVGGAVVRNRVRRALREIIRPARPQLRAGCWVVVVARHQAAQATPAELAADWLRLARRAGILPPAAPAAPAPPLPPSASPASPPPTRPLPPAAPPGPAHD